MQLKISKSIWYINVRILSMDSMSFNLLCKHVIRTNNQRVCQSSININGRSLRYLLVYASNYFGPTSNVNQISAVTRINDTLAKV